MSDGPAATPFWEMRGVSKHYVGVRALQNVDFSCERGTIHAVLGENGAGKSTLIKIIAGVVQPSEGEMFLEGRRVAFSSPVAANNSGIVCIFQELSLMPDLSVADNICITDPPRRFGLIDRRGRTRSPASCSRASAAPTCTPWSGCAICPSRAVRWSRSPRHWAATPSF